MIKKIKNTLVLIMAVFLFSCGGSNNEQYEIINKSEEGQLRGVSLGMTIEAVKAKEDVSFLKSEKPDYLHYDYPINMGNSYTVAYDFSEENKLYEIELTVFFDEIEDAKTLFLDFEEKFNQKYGVGEKADDGFTIWEMRSDALSVEFAMINDSQAYGYLSIIVRDLDY